MGDDLLFSWGSLRIHRHRFRATNFGPAAIWPMLMACAALLAAPCSVRAAVPGPAWKRHAIDNAGRGADGIKLADINGDGRFDAATGWEEDGSTRIYFNPGPLAAKDPWPRVVLSNTPSIEDAVFADLDGDGAVDVVSATEGDSRQLIAWWAPLDITTRREATAWRRDVFPATAGLTRWMFVTPAQVDGRFGPDLIAGGRRTQNGARSVLGWLESPPEPHDLAGWRWHPLIEVGWTMSIEWEDMDGDGDRDILTSDRVGPTRGVFWLENPGVVAVRAGQPWARHPIGAADATEVMFLSVGDLDGDGRRDVAVAIGARPRDPVDPSRENRVAWFRREDATGRHWTPHLLAAPDDVGGPKGVAIGDIDGDGRADLVLSCEYAGQGRTGVYWLRQGRTGDWSPHNISGDVGIKFDLIQLMDVDEDGDLDVLTSEESEGGGGLGVIWYENPTR